MLACEFYHKIKPLFHKLVTKSEFIYVYTTDCVVTSIMFKSRKGKYTTIDNVPHDKLLLSRELALPQHVIVQIKFSPLTFNLLEG